MCLGYIIRIIKFRGRVRSMSKANHIPYSWAEIEEQVREAILCQLSILQCLGPSSDELGRLYLGIDPDLLELTGEDHTEEDRQKTLRSIDLTRHHLHYLACSAYNYAYQLEGWEAAGSGDHHEIVCAVLSGFPQTDMHGNPSPLSNENDFPLRRMFDTFVARWKLYADELDDGLSTRELALLSNMTIPAVRTSLSKEGFKLDMPGVRLEGGRREDAINKDDALLWLSRRRSFTPTGERRAEEPAEIIARLFGIPEYAFDHALRQSMIALRTDAATLAHEIDASAPWLETLSKGGIVEIDVPALRRLARKLRLSEPDVVARAVQHLIRLEVGKATDT